MLQNSPAWTNCVRPHLPQKIDQPYRPFRRVGGEHQREKLAPRAFKRFEKPERIGSWFVPKSGQEAKENDAKRIDIGCRARLAAVLQLRREITACPHDKAARRFFITCDNGPFDADLALDASVLVAGDSEVDKHGIVLRVEQDVRRLDVAVYYSFGMDAVKR